VYKFWDKIGPMLGIKPNDEAIAKSIEDESGLTDNIA
jgi:hypothetical protein